MSGGFSILDSLDTKEEEKGDGLLSAQNTIFGSGIDLTQKIAPLKPNKGSEGSLTLNPFKKKNISSAVNENIELDLPETKFTQPDVSFPEVSPELDFKGGEIDISLPDFPDVNIDENISLDVIDLSGITNPLNDLVSEPNFTTEPIEEAAEIVLNVGEELGEAIGDVATPVGEAIVNLTDPAREAVEEVVNNTTDLVGDLSEGTEIRQGTGDEFGEISVGEGFVIDISQNIDNQFAEVTEGTSLENVAASDVYTAIHNPLGFIEEKTTEEAIDFISDNSVLEGSEVSDLIRLATDPEEFLLSQGVEGVSDLISANIPTPGGSAAIAAGLVSLIDGGDFEQVATVVGNTIAQEIAYGAANAVLPGSGEVLRLLVALGVDDAVVDFFGEAGEAAFEALGGDENLIGGGAVGGVLDAIDDVSGTVKDAFNSIVSYGCNLSTIAFKANLISKDEFMDFPRYRIKIQRHEKHSDKFWSGYVLLTNGLNPRLIKHKILNIIFFKCITRPWLHYMQYKLGKRRFSIVGCFIMQTIKMISFISYSFNKKKAKKLNNFFKYNSIMKIYRNILKGNK